MSNNTSLIKDKECNLNFFWMSSNYSSSVKQSYIEFQTSKWDVLYIVGNIKKLSTTFIQTTFPDSIVRVLKNRIQPKLFLNSRLRKNVILKQRYLTNQIIYRVDSRGIGKILKSSYSHNFFIIFGWVDFNWLWDKGRLLQKTDPGEHDVPNPTIYLLTQTLISLTMELLDMPTKFQHSIQKSNSHINIIINQLGTPKFTTHF